MKRIPNLETAIAECRNRGLKFNWEWYRTSHIKFHVDGIRGYICLSSKKCNPDKVRKDIRNYLTGLEA
mgnify:CR=1 FL=1